MCVCVCVNSDPSKSAEASQHIAVDEAALCWRGQGLVQQVVDEVDARLHGQNHALLNQAAHAQAFQAWLSDALHPLRQHRARGTVTGMQY